VENLAMMPFDAPISFRAPNPGGFVDRGDPAVWDYFLGAPIIADGTWYPLDLVAIVGTAAAAVLLRVSVSSAGAGDQIIFRRYGNVAIANAARVITPAAATVNDQNVIVPCDLAGVLAYMADNVPWFNIDITVRGWWRR
jgi:hypothetical protein